MDVIKKLLFSLLIFSSTLASNNQIVQYLKLINCGEGESEEALTLRDELLKELQTQAYEKQETDYDLERAIESIQGYDYASIFESLLELLPGEKQSLIYANEELPPNERRRRFRLDTKDLRLKLFRKKIEEKMASLSPQIQPECSPKLEAEDVPNIGTPEQEAENNSNLLEE